MLHKYSRGSYISFKIIFLFQNVNRSITYESILLFFSIFLYRPEINIRDACIIEDIGRPRAGTVVCELHQNKKMQALGTSENINEGNQR